MNNNNKLRRKTSSRFNKNKKRNILIISLYSIFLVLYGLILFVLNKILNVHIIFSNQTNEPINNEPPNNNNNNNQKLNINNANKLIEEITNLPSIIENEIKKQLKDKIPIKNNEINQLIDNHFSYKSDIKFDFLIKLQMGFNSFMISLDYNLQDGKHVILDNTLKVKMKLTNNIKKTFKDNKSKIMEHFEYIFLELILYIQHKYFFSKKDNDDYNFINLGCLYSRLKHIEGSNYYNKIYQLNSISKGSSFIDRISNLANELKINDKTINKNQIINLLNISEIKELQDFPLLINNFINTSNINNCKKTLSENSPYYNIVNSFNYDLIENELDNIIDNKKKMDDINKNLKKTKMIKISMLCLVSLFLIMKIFLIYNNNLLVKIFYGVFGWFFLINIFILSLGFFLISFLGKKFTENTEIGDFIKFKIHFHTVIPLIASIMFLIIKLTPIKK